MGETQYRLPFPADKIAEMLNIVNDLGAWAKASEKPTYTADEVGARPDTWMPSASEVGADPAGTAAGAVSSHNTADDAHSDIRLLVAGLTTRLNALADSDDETLDQASELVAYIKANRELIESVTTGKVSVSDIVDNLATNLSNKPLSAAQGVKLKALIDGITVPTKVSELQNDAGYLTQHQDISGKANASDLTAHTGNSTVHVTAEERKSWNQAVTDVGNLSEEIADHTGNSTVHVTAEEKAAWNGKSDFSGSYNDLSDKPTIPTVPSKVSAFTNDAGYLTQHQDVSGKEDKSNKVTSLSAESTDQQYPSAKCVYDMIGNVEALLAEI